MGIKCLLGYHDWAGCKCTVCGTMRDEGHIFDGAVCKGCGKFDIDQANERLIDAAMAGDVKLVQHYLEIGADINTYGVMALMEAAGAGHADIVNILLNKGADVNVETYNGWTALSSAAYAGHTDIVRILIDNGANTNAMSNDGATVLIRAVKQGRADIMRILLDNGANIEANESNYGRTALMAAVIEGSAEIIGILLDNGADVNAQDRDGKTALMYAVIQDHADIADIVRVLLDKGANVNAKNRDGKTALMRAAFNGHAGVVSALLGKGADVNAKAYDGSTALIMASRQGHADVVQMLKAPGGRLGKPQASISQKTFRVFVSSTFSDMKAERAILQEDVFKRLKEDCRKRGAVFQDIDLRWGVTEKATKTHQTMKICLSEIARCQNISPKPNFVVLLGDRYGWQPIPAEIPADEAIAMKQAMSSEEWKLFDNWYKEDTNAVPSLYILQSISDRADKWAKEEDALRQLLREFAKKAGLSPSQIKYFCSATHQEIISGALNPQAGSFDPSEHVFCYFRKPVAIRDKEILKDYVDLDKQGIPDIYCRDQLYSLKTTLFNRLPDNHIYPYPGVLDGNIVRPERPQEFADRVYEDLKVIIFRQLDEFKEKDALTQEIARHNASAERAVSDFTGREDTVGKMLTYLSGTDNRVYALVGDSGSGKTAVMARAVQLSRKQSNAVIIPRFLGTTGGASNIESLLTQIDEEIAGEYGATINFIRGKGDKRKMEKDVFQECLMLARQERPLVIFLDALDQLPEFGRQMLMDAIPKNLPTCCRIVVSGTPEVEPLFADVAKELLSPMTEGEGETLLTAWLVRSGRALRDDQKKTILDRFCRNGLPLYFKLLFEGARQWHSYDIVVPELPDDMEGILREYFQWLEQQHTRELISTVMGYLLCSRHKGIPEDDVIELLARDEEYWKSFLKKYPFHSEEAIRLKRIPVVLWSRLYLDLEPYLTERTEDGTTLLIFYHRQFGQYTLNSYVKGHEEHYCRNLGEYGEERMRSGSPTVSQLGYTALYGLVYYLQAGLNEKVKELILWMFTEAERINANIAPVEKLAPYVIEEGSEEEKKMYRDVLENCSREMPENLGWGGYLGRTGYSYEHTVFQQWSIFYYQKAIEIEEKIHKENPDNINVANSLAATHNNLGRLLQESNRFDEALTHHQQAIEIGEKIYKKNPENIDTANTLAHTYNNLGWLLKQSNRFDEAATYYEKAIVIGEKIYKMNPDNINIADSLATTYGNLGRLLQESDRFDEAATYYEKATVIGEKIYKKNPENVSVANGLATTYGNLGSLLYESNRFDEAVAYYGKAIEIGEKIYKKNPENIDVAGNLATIYNNLGWQLQNSNRYEEAVTYYEKAIKIEEKIHKENPDNINVATSLATTCINLGWVLYRSNRFEKAELFMRQAVEIFLMLSRSGHPHQHLQEAIILHAAVLKALGKNK